MLLEKIKLEPNEKILLQTRRHWFMLFSQLAFIALSALAPLGIFTLLNSAGTTAQALNYPATLSFVYFLWLILMWIGAFNILTNYYLDVMTITDRRVVVVNQKGFFRRWVASFRLERLQDMQTEVNGLIATLLNFGTIAIETAGHSDEEFKVTNMPKPDELKSIILQASDNLINTSTNHETIGV